MTYPPAPWRLRGQMSLSLWRVPRRRLPEPPSGTQPVVLGGHGLAGVAWVVYEPSGDLAYNELLAAILVRRSLRPRVSITHIWVDSQASLEGGRALWGIPKEGATFDTTGSGERAAWADASGDAIASATFWSHPRLPGSWPVRFTVAQLLNGRLQESPVRCRTRLEVATARWETNADGALAWLRDLRPLCSVRLRGFRLRFGG